MTVLTLNAPAKLNLGLAITGPRPDGFHNLVTIFQTVDLCDTLEFRVPENQPRDWLAFECSDSTLATQDNLVIKAVEAMRSSTGCTLPIDIRLNKAIPVAAGLGGASSDAGATLRALNQLWELGLPTQELLAIASELGSDVPFFLSGGCALGQGRGELLRPLRAHDTWFVVVYPEMTLPFRQKTAAMFGALQPDDFGDGIDILAQASRLDAGLPLDPELLGNAFERPLYDLVPALRAVHKSLMDAGASRVALTGAGPTHYAVAASEGEADRIARAFKSLYGSSAHVSVCRSC